MPVIYYIRIKGHLDLNWAAELEGLSLRHLDDGTTLLHGIVADQAGRSLAGVIIKSCPQRPFQL